MKYIIGAAVLIAVLVSIYLRPHSSGVGPQSLGGQPAVSYAAQDTSGRSQSLAQFRGKIVVLNFWASWCPPCRAEMPDLERLYAADRNRGVVVVGIDEGESAQHAAAFARSLGIGYPIWIDADQQYGRAYASLGLPASVVIDRTGTIVRGFDGPVSMQELQQTVDPMLRSS